MLRDPNYGHEEMSSISILNSKNTGWSAREISARFVIRLAHLLGDPIYIENEERVACIFVKDVLKVVILPGRHDCVVRK